MRLFVNVDHVATIREARKTMEPDPLEAARLAERAGADGITIHLREDRRHIQDGDVIAIRQHIETRLNLEMAAVDEMVDIAIDTRPYQVSLVPENRQEITTEGGLNVHEQEIHLMEIKNRLVTHGILVSLFIDPDPIQIDSAKRIGADSIEINTGLYSELLDPKEIEVELGKIRNAAIYAVGLNLKVFAGHGLNNENVIPIAAIPEIEELNIGHNIVAKAIYSGMERSVKEMIKSIEKGVSLRPKGA
ncbi:MAG: pyridoxine 5'-phosphate synthase [Nitrospinales bacterium]